MAFLKNDFVKLSVDERGRIDELSLAGGHNVIARPAPLFRAVMLKGENWECTALGEDQTLRVIQEEDAIRIQADRLSSRMGDLDISVEMTLRLDGDQIRFGSTLDNRSDATVNEWFYPCLGEIDTLEGGRPDLLFPRHLGERVRDVGAYLQNIRRRDGLHELSATYPGPMSMQWMILEDGGTCLYLTGHDAKIHASALRAKGSEAGGVTLEMNKMAFVRPGEKWVCPEYLARLYRGSWMEGAREYAAWASSWRVPVKPKEWIRHMNGYFLVIMKQQYGDECWRYGDIPKLYDYAQAHGFDTLGLFGWYHSGHDNRYPELEVSPTMGSAEGLKAGIGAVHDRGGHVTLYYQGHLMDVGTDYYRNEGSRLAGKTRWGTPYYEFYDKFCFSDYLHYFSKKPFATICPSCVSWHELMAQRADWVHSFGADGILYDQIGGMPPYPCFDVSHGHMEDRPSLSHTQGRIRLHKRIRAQVDTHENFAYMTEHVTDVHSQFLDCLHGIGSYPGAKGDGASNAEMAAQRCNADSAGMIMMPELFRYTFPETMITIRNPKPYVDRRFANYALLYGYKLEMELRYETDRTFIEEDRDPADRDYAFRLAKMRADHEDYLILGRFLAQEGLSGLTPGVKAAVYAREDGRRAVALWNDTDETLPIGVVLEGQALNAWVSPEGAGDGIPGTIGPEGAMMLYMK